VVFPSYRQWLKWPSGSAWEAFIVCHVVGTTGVGHHLGMDRRLPSPGHSL